MTKAAFDKIAAGLHEARGYAQGQSEAAAEIERLRAFVDWVDSWVSNPVTSYSVYALDGLFGMTRDKIAAIRAHHRNGENDG